MNDNIDLLGRGGGIAPTDDTGPDSSRAEKILRQAHRSFDRRQIWEQIWDQVYDLTQPERWQRHKEVKTPNDLWSRLYDSTAVHSSQQLANTMVSGLVPPWVKWFMLEAGPNVPKDEASKLNAALEIPNEQLHLALNISNFVQEVQPAFLDCVIGGTGCIRMQPHVSGKGVEFKSIPITELAIEENSAGVVSDVYRRHKMKNRDLLTNDKWAMAIRERDQQWAERMMKSPNDETEVWETNTPLENGKTLHMKMINRGVADAPGGDGPIVLEERELKHVRYIVFRWAGTPGHPYGRSPAIMSFGDIRAVNKMKEMLLKNAAMQVAGVWAVNSDEIINPRNTILRPGAMVTLRKTAPSEPGLVNLTPNGQFEVANFGIGELRQSIKNAFLSDQFSPTVGTKMTATEIVARTRIIAQNLGATYGRLQNELLIPLVRSLVDILRAQGEIAPEIKLDRDTFDVAFLSSLALSQRLQEIDDMVSFASISAQLSELDPKSGLIIDGLKYQERIADLYNISATLLRKADEVTRMEQEAIQQQQLAAQQEQAGGAGQVAPVGAGPIPN